MLYYRGRKNISTNLQALIYELIYYCEREY